MCSLKVSRRPCSEIVTAFEVLHHIGPRELIERDAVTARRCKRAAGTHRDLQALSLLPAAGLELRQRLGQVRHPIDKDGPLAFKVVCEQNVRRTGGEPDHRHPRSHRVDAEGELSTQDVYEVFSVRRNVLAGGGEVVELNKRFGHSDPHQPNLVSLHALPGGYRGPAVTSGTSSA